MTICFFGSILSLSINILIYDRDIFWSRIFSFIQFLIAIVISIRIKERISKKQIFNLLSLFVILTIVFLLTNGYLEKNLIFSRANFVVGSGRGASTLSPEPSFFAIHIFNILIISYLIYDWCEDVKFHNINLILAAVCFISSLSGYGLVILLMLLLLRYPKTFILVIVILFIFRVNFIELVESISNTRVGSLIINIFNNNIDNLFEADASFHIRYISFIIYLESFYSNILLGEGYSIFEGGGFISVISAFGILYIMFFSFVLYKILTLAGAHYKVKILLVFWFLINVLSGPIGIPSIGFIIGLIIFRKTNHIELQYMKLNK